MQKSDIDTIVSNLLGFLPIDNPGTPILDDELREIETRVSGVLPETFKLFSRYGAGVINSEVIVECIRQVPKSVSESKTVNLGVFLGSEKGEGFNIIEILNTMGSRFPTKTYPFNYTFGNYFIIDVEDSENYGKVYYFVTSEDIDDEEFYEQHQRKITRAEKFTNCYLIANSFEEFLQKLRIDPDQ